MAFKFPENKLRTAIQNDTAAIGIMAEIESVAIVELAAAAGMDFVRFDLCHNHMDMAELEKCVITAERHEITPIVRISVDHPDIERMIEMGVMGFVFPDMDSAEKAREAVRRVKFAPLGDRGLFSAARQTGYGAVPAPDYIEWANENITIGVQIESKEAISNLDEILKIEGIDLIHSGRGDLSNSLGVPGQKNHPIVDAAEREIFAKAIAAGKAAAPQISFTDPDLPAVIEDLINRGARQISLGIDTAIIKKAFVDLMKKVRG